MAKSVLPGVPHVPKTPKVGYLGPVNPNGQAASAKVKQLVPRLSPLKRATVQVGKMKRSDI